MANIADFLTLHSREHRYNAMAVRPSGYQHDG
jgi:hypothetical protein